MKSRNYSGLEFRVQGCPPLGFQKKAGRLLGIIVILLLVFLPFIPSSAKVFWSRFLTQERSKFDATGNWRRIYKASLTINGARAEFSILGCDEPLELVKTRLAQCFGSSNENYLIENENSFRMSSAAGNKFTRLLALAMPNSDKSLIFDIECSASEFSKSRSVPRESIFHAYSLLDESEALAELRRSHNDEPAVAKAMAGRLAIHPCDKPQDTLAKASRVETIIKNEETGAVLETRIADAAPDLIIREISAKLFRHGWKLVYPAGNGGNSKQRFLIFRRGEALCTLLAGPALRANKTCVTILLKEKMDNKGE